MTFLKKKSYQSVLVSEIINVSNSDFLITSIVLPCCTHLPTYTVIVMYFKALPVAKSSSKEVWPINAATQEENAFHS